MGSQEALQRFLLDQDTRRRLAENNRFAALEIAGRVGEAMRRGYLNCGDEELTGFQNAVLELEAWIEEKT